MNCAEVRQVLPAYESASDADLAVRRHLAGCPGCSAELERYDALRSSLGALRSVKSDVPVGLTEALVAIPSRGGVVGSVRGHVTRHRAAYLGGVAAALAATTAVVWRARSRPAAA